MKHLIGESQNGIPIYVQLIGSQAGESIARQPQLLSLAKEMFAKVMLRGTKINLEYDMDRPVGYDFVVETSAKDTILYGRLLKDDVYTRFVKNGQPQPTNYITVTLLQSSNDNYELSDIWLGRLMPPRPGSENETADSKSYWSSHALILDNQRLQLQTMTKTCPY